jgi:zinc transporter ZupT
VNATHASILRLSCLSLVTTWIGVWLAKRLHENAQGIATGIGFSVGIMLLISLIELVPEATAAAGLFPALGTFVLGAGLVWSANVIVPHHHPIEEMDLFNSRALRTASASAATTLFGMLVSFPMISRISGPSLDALLALSAGVLMYVCASHLLPRAEKENKMFCMVAMAGSVLVAIIIVISMV